MKATTGQRKAALYLASLSPRDSQALLSLLPASSTRVLQPLLRQIAANGWNDPSLAQEALADEVRGLTAQSSLSIDALLALSKVLPADWTARLFASNSALDSRFLLALLDGPASRRVGADLARYPRLPERLRDALLIEAQASVRMAD